VLAYHLVHSLRHQLAKKGIHYSWQTIRDAMSTQVRTTTQLKRDDGKMISIRKSSEPEVFHQKIYQALKIHPYPGGVEKTIL
ncbi:MAG: transposase, partial [SAR324 cluster bacterium]|nr:transposase [SAR324 cluster bacterium]